jgi:hypothetical protein
MTATAPWWGAPVLAGGFTLLGVGLSQLFTVLLDRIGQNVIANDGGM